eukprot:2186236-Rhodomonas_salina.1
MAMNTISPRSKSTESAKIEISESSQSTCNVSTVFLQKDYQDVIEQGLVSCTLCAYLGISQHIRSKEGFGRIQFENNDEGVRCDIRSHGNCARGNDGCISTFQPPTAAKVICIASSQQEQETDECGQKSCALSGQLPAFCTRTCLHGCLALKCCMVSPAHGETRRCNRAESATERRGDTGRA